MFTRNNITARIFERQIRTPAPGTSVHRARRFYENIVPGTTIYEVECPDHSFRKFTEDGKYLISFSRSLQDLIVYRPTWLSFSCKQEDCDKQDLPAKAKKFESFFTQLYSVPLASANELICKDFFLYAETNQFGLFATSTAQIYDAPATGGAIQGVPSIEKITFHLLRLEDGVVLDERVFCNDYINLAHSMGVFLFDDLLAIVSLRYQRIHILQIRDSGSLVDLRAIGEFCREDDELFLNSTAQAISSVDKRAPQHIPVNNAVNGPHLEQPAQENPFLSGIKQRLLSFIVRGIQNEEKDETMRIQSLKKKFYFHFQDYVDLIIWKVQFLDRHHLLIKFGSVDGAVSRNADNHPAFFAVYNMESTEIIAFYQMSSDELYLLFEQFCDHFHVPSKSSPYMNFISSHSNSIHALEQLRSSKNKATSFPLFIKKVLVSLPFNCQSQSPSPYFDQSLFRFDEKLISAADRHRQSTDHPIKFILRRPPHTLKFKIKPAPHTTAISIAFSLIALITGVVVISAFIGDDTTKLVCTDILNNFQSTTTPMQLRAILHYATSKTVSQQSLSEISNSFNVLKSISPCNFLGFGLGHDSLMWGAFNPNWLTLFLEEYPKWVQTALKDALDPKAAHVSYCTQLQQADELMRIYRSEPECSPEKAYIRGPEAGITDCRTKRISSFLFHPILPLAISVQQTLFLQPAVVNIHFRR